MQSIFFFLNLFCWFEICFRNSNTSTMQLFCGIWLYYILGATYLLEIVRRKDLIDETTEKWILRQSNVCPHVALCKLNNYTAQLESKLYFPKPCCFECSCEPSCMQENSCCPDFGLPRHGNDRTGLSETSSGDIADSMFVVKSADNFTELPKAVSNLTSQLACAGTKVAETGADHGFLMISKCPDGFNNTKLINACEAKLDVDALSFLERQVPVTDSASGLSYKNIFCLFCHEDSTTGALFWEVWVNCIGNLQLPLYVFGNLGFFALELLKSTGKVCEVEYKLHPGFSVNISKLSECKIKQDIIGTCGTGVDSNGEDSKEEIEEMCNSGYIWPVVGQDLLVYKNYACLACKGKEPSQFCPQRPQTFTFGVKLNMANVFEALTMGLERGHFETGGTDRESSNSEVASDKQVCPDGYIYDTEMNLCRLVLCPVYFYLLNGRCVPMFERISGLSYLLLVEIKIPDFLHGINVSQVDQAIFTSLEDKVKDTFDRKMFGISLWTNDTSFLTINPGKRYVALFDFNETIPFEDMIHFVKHFAIQENSFEVNLKFKETNGTDNITLFTNFNPELVLTSLYIKSVRPPYEIFALVKFELLQKNENKINTNTLLLTQSFLCNRIVLYEEEADKIWTNIFIRRSDVLLPEQQYQRIVVNGSKWTVVCQEFVFQSDQPFETVPGKSTTKEIYHLGTKLEADFTDSGPSIRLPASLWVLGAMAGMVVMILSSRAVIILSAVIKQRLQSASAKAEVPDLEHNKNNTNKLEESINIET